MNHHAEIGVLKHHRAATGDQIHVTFNVAVSDQRTGQTVILQRVLNTAVRHEEGVLTAENIHVVDLHFIAIATQCNGLVVTRINATAQGV